MASGFKTETHIGAGNDDSLICEGLIRVGEGDEFLAINEAEEGRHGGWCVASCTGVL